MDDVFQVAGGLARVRGISLVGSGDPIIHMWIMGRCVCRYTARVASLCVLAVLFYLYRQREKNIVPLFIIMMLAIPVPTT